MNLVTPIEARTEAAKGLKQAIAVSIKKFEPLLLLTCKDIRAWDRYHADMSGATCGLCQYFNPDRFRYKCGRCVLKINDCTCYDADSCFDSFNQAFREIRHGNVTTITDFRKKVRKMIKILKKLYKEQK